MNENEIDFKSDINKYAINMEKNILINNINIKLNVIQYDDIKIINCTKSLLIFKPNRSPH